MNALWGDPSGEPSAEPSAEALSPKGCQWVALGARLARFKTKPRCRTRVEPWAKGTLKRPLQASLAKVCPGNPLAVNSAFCGDRKFSNDAVNLRKADHPKADKSAPKILRFEALTNRVLCAIIYAR